MLVKTPEVSDALIMAVRSTAKTSIDCFKTLVGTGSRTHDFDFDFSTVSRMKFSDTLENSEIVLLHGN